MTDAAPLIADVSAALAEPVAQVQYVEIRDADTLEPLTTVDRPAVMAVAAFVGTTRLIDNVRLG